jgi:DNA replication protein DnaC
MKGHPMTLADPVSPDLKRHLRTLKLGQLLATLPDRLTLARQQKLPHADFLELLLSDEVTRRENGSAARRARAAGLDPDMRLDTWDPSAAVRYDQQLWNELVSLRFTEAAHGALVLGPVGVGKTHLATALGHIAVRRRLAAASPCTWPAPATCSSASKPPGWTTAPKPSTAGWPR